MDFKAELAAIQYPPKCPGWSTRVQEVCEQTWSRAGSEEGISADVFEGFIIFLLNDDAFDVARLVVPALREPSETNLLTVQQRGIVERLQQSREMFDLKTSQQQQASFDDELYRAEKDIFLDAEVHRASMLLNESGLLDPARLEEIQAWLSARPRPTVPPPPAKKNSGPQATPEGNGKVSEQRV